MGRNLAWMFSRNNDPYSDHIQDLWSLATRKKQSIPLKVLRLGLNEMTL